MSAVLLPDRNQPSFYRFPVNNNRTGFKPVYLPMILVVPRRRSFTGTTFANSGVWDVRFYIADAPDPSKVAGPFNTELLVPQSSRFILYVTDLQLIDVQIDLNGRSMMNMANETVTTAKDGDHFSYTTVRGNITSDLIYYSDADYYDLSLFNIDVEDLPRPNRYYFIWECKFYRRIKFNSGLIGQAENFCISDKIGIARSLNLIAHPGEVHDEMFRKTPPFYFDLDGKKLSQDKTLEFYRPFADILQDVFDEQTLINGINHIEKIPAQILPYLAFLIGWDLPNFPGVSDSVRRSILRRAVYLQKLKGTKRTIVELFDVFGFIIDLINLWYSTDGQRLIAPNEKLPIEYSGQEIVQQTVCQSEPLISNYETAGWGSFEIPLVYKASGNIAVMALLVTDGPTKNVLIDLTTKITNDPDYLKEYCSLPGGKLSPHAFVDLLPSSDSTLLGYADVELDVKTGEAISSATSNIKAPIINTNGTKYDPIKNLVQIVFDHYLDFSECSLFVFAVYSRQEIILPKSLNNLRSNRFDVRIYLKDGQEVEPHLLEFLLQFIIKLKAFHSLLRKIIFEQNNYLIYNVTDYCSSLISGEVDCTENITSAELSNNLLIKERISNGLLEEFLAWKNLDNTHESDPSKEIGLNLPVSRPDDDSFGYCQFTKYGQERIQSTPDGDFDHELDKRAKFCSDVESNNDCFKGRVVQLLDSPFILSLIERVKCKPCGIDMGIGAYWLYPSNDLSNKRNGFGSFSGEEDSQFLGGLIRQYDNPIPWSLHFTNRPVFYFDQLKSDRFLAYQRPSINIEKDNLNFPSHRFPFMRNLTNDFVHPVWKARPWDGLGGDFDAKLVWDGINWVLNFNEVELIYEGNGLLPDISSLGEHEDRDFLVTHSIYISSPAGHPAVSLDSSVTLTTDDSINLDSSLPFNKIFRSADCGKDYVSGYPSSYGRISMDLSSVGFSRGGSLELSEALGIPSERTSLSSMVDVLFTLRSQILVLEGQDQYRYYVPYRLDCDCLKFPCGGSTGSTGLTGLIDYNSFVNVITCPTNLFLTSDGIDPNCDRVSAQSNLVFREEFGSCSFALDGEIPNLLCVLGEDGLIQGNFDILSFGSIYWQDFYGVIYESYWVYNYFPGDGCWYLDILMITKSPGVWGQPMEGYVEGVKVFKKGIITRTRMIIKVCGSSYEIRGKADEQEVGFFQVNQTCGQRKFIDSFCLHLNCGVSDLPRCPTAVGGKLPGFDVGEWGTGGSGDGCSLVEFIINEVS